MKESLTGANAKYLCLPLVPNFVKREAILGLGFTSHDLRTVGRIQTLRCVVEIETLATRS